MFKAGPRLNVHKHSYKMSLKIKFKSQIVGGSYGSNLIVPLSS